MTTNALKLNPHFVTNQRGRRTGVLIDMKSWRRLQELIEDIEDVASIDESRNEETVPLEQVLREERQKRGL